MILYATLVCMTIIGIDYGTKRVGIAFSDTSEMLAFPKKNVLATEQLLERLLQEIHEQKAHLVVLGHSMNSQGEDNPVMKEVHQLKKDLEENNIQVVLEPEFLSSQEARRFQGRDAEIDASAAAVILQRFLDRRRTSLSDALE